MHDVTHGFVGFLLCHVKNVRVVFAVDSCCASQLINRHSTANLFVDKLKINGNAS